MMRAFFMPETGTGNTYPKWEQHDDDTGWYRNGRHRKHHR